MPQTPHVEAHFTASEVVRDLVIGMSDGLMKFELGLEEPDPRRAGRSALTIAASYVFGGLAAAAAFLLAKLIG